MILKVNLFPQSINYKLLASESIQIGFAFDKPLLEQVYDYSFLTGTFNFNMNVPIFSMMNLEVDIPFYNYDYSQKSVGYFSYFTERYTAQGFGNIKIGLQTRSTSFNPRYSFISYGVFLPTMSGFSRNFLFRLNFYEFEKYIKNVVGLYFDYQYIRKYENNFFIGTEFSPTMIFTTEDFDGIISFHYGINGGFQVKRLSFNAQLLGTYLIDAGVVRWSSTIFDSADLGIKYDFGEITIKAFYRIFLNEFYSDIHNGLCGIGIEVKL